MSEPRGTIPSPNIWGSPQVYEIENLANDHERLLDAAIAASTPLSGARVLDVGCGTGFHLPRLLAAGATWVLGVEPHLPLLAAAHARVANLTAAAVVAGSAEALPIPDGSIDVVHSRWAYFFGAGSEPGLAQVARVLRSGGVHVVVDHDPSVSTFGRWFTAAYPAYDPVGVRRFWQRHGYTTQSLTVTWTFQTREDLAAVLAIELPPASVEAALAEHTGLTIDVGVAVRHWRR